MDALQKVFDTIEYKTAWKALEKFGVDDCTVRMIKQLCRWTIVFGLWHDGEGDRHTTWCQTRQFSISTVIYFNAAIVSR